MVLLLVFAVGVPTRAQEPGDPLRNARARYAAAEYQETLAEIDRVKVDTTDTGLRIDVEKLRGFCLLALGRTVDADRAFETVVTLDPRRTLQPGEAAPWVSAAFDAVRRRVAPVVASRDYEKAMAAADRGEYEQAIPLFRELLDLLDDPRLATAFDASQTELRTSAQAHLRLALGALNAQPSGVQRTAYRATTGLIPLRQYIPSLPPELVPFAPFINRELVVEIEVDETGRVTDAVLHSSLARRYDALLLQAARTWLFRPATTNGAAVRVRQTIIVTVPLS